MPLRKPSRKLHQPKRVCSFDIETETKKGDRARLLLAGVMVYTRHDDKYFPSRYQAYERDDLASLIAFLKDFKGIILGHNIFDFDYRVLHDECRLENICAKLQHRTTGQNRSPELNLHGVIEKSVDTLWFAARKKRGRGGLSLRSLVRLNLKMAAKGTIEKRFASYWHHGKRQHARDYNKNDCRITFQLWWAAVRDKQLYFPINVDRDPGLLSPSQQQEFYKRLDRRWIITPSEAQYLTGQKQIFGFANWWTKLCQGEILPVPKNNNAHVTLTPV